jgi:hypothetical protein
LASSFSIVQFVLGGSYSNSSFLPLPNTPSRNFMLKLGSLLCETVLFLP